MRPMPLLMPHESARYATNLHLTLLRAHVACACVCVYVCAVNDTVEMQHHIITGSRESRGCHPSASETGKGSDTDLSTCYPPTQLSVCRRLQMRKHNESALPRERPA